MEKRQRKMNVQAICTDLQKVREEIAYLEARIDEMGFEGDCAYERAMVRFFEQQVGMRRDWLKAG